MLTTPFRVSEPTDRPCWACTAYEGLTAGGTAALCSRKDGARVRSWPDLGCCSWERAQGTDDVPGGYPDGFFPPERGARVWAARKAPVVVEWAP